MYHYIAQAWKKPDVKILRERMTEWRKTEAFVKVEKPLRLDKARKLGYKDKKGFVVVRVRLMRGGHKRKTDKRKNEQENAHEKKLENEL